MAAQQNVVSLDAYRSTRRAATRPTVLPVICWVPCWFVVPAPAAVYWPAARW